jgi:hypothetical protein
MTVGQVTSDTHLVFQPLHAGQAAAYWALKPHRFKALRCGRRFGKTELGKTWIAQGLVQGSECAWFAPQHKTWSETYTELHDLLRAILMSGSKGSGVLRLRTGGRLDFWTLENAIAGRGRRYRRIVIDEAAFAKDGNNKVDGSIKENLGESDQADFVRLLRRGARLLELGRKESR